MKNSRNVLFMLSLSFLILFNACSLDEVIKDTPTPKTATSESDVTALIGGMYSRFNDSGMFKFLGFNMLILCADDIWSGQGSDYGPYAKRTFTDSNTAAMWNNLYASIANANNLIEVLDDLELTPAFETRAYGEAYFVRAFCYYYLVRLYGGVPLRLEATTIKSDFYLPRTTTEETYTQIFKDFKMASERLPLKSAMSAAELGRATKGSAQALLADAYLTFGNQLSLKGQTPDEYYGDAILYADSVINSNQYTLLANYGDLFDISKENGAYEEVIFGIRFQTDGNARAQPAAGSEYANSFGAGNTWGVTANAGNGGNNYRVSHWFADYYRKGDYWNGVSIFTPNIDYRNEKAFFQRGYNPTGNNGSPKYYAVYPNVPGSTIPSASNDGTINDPLVAKYQDPTGKDTRNHGNDLFIIRYASVLLTKAEALNELNGPTPDALAAFNQVRYRARTVNSVPEARTIPTDLTTITAPDKATFRMKIFDERGLEFVGEGLRWFDLVRMQSPTSPSKTMYEYQFKEVLSNTAIYTRRTNSPTYNASSQTYSPASNTIYAPLLNVTVPKFLLFPIPATERTQNPVFGDQNFGW